jgi:two-component system cell cycle response regulator DivK
VLRQERSDDEWAWADAAGRVLLVDCLPDEQALYGDALRDAGFDPVIECEASASFQMAVGTGARVIAINLSFRNPELDLVRQLRRDARTTSCALIVISAAAFQSDREAAQQAGCDVFLPKPCLPDTFVAHVRLAFDQMHRQ